MALRPENYSFSMPLRPMVMILCLPKSGYGSKISGYGYMPVRPMSMNLCLQTSGYGSVALRAIFI